MFINRLAADKAMRITLSPATSAQDNASLQFERAKKLRKKAEGARASIVRLQDQLANLEKQRDEIIRKAEAAAQEKAAKRAAAESRKQHWFEKFRWFRSSEGFLCVGGRDASTNEIVIKKHSNPSDVVFHTEAPGSPFFVIQTEGRKPGDATLRETLEATISYSKAWKLGISMVDAYWINADQVTKAAKAGEFVPHGGFMIYGRKNMMSAQPRLAIGVVDNGPEAGLVMGGPVSAVEKHCARRVTIVQGDDKPSDVAKKIAKVLGASIDDVLRVLPSGGMKVVTK
jgi:predicted ribosome quality control (RQC) complex YloA/Tae2 family protein